jgi:mono/diheme cytochrome c family protein
MFERMLIDKMENRILVGASMFVGILILVGWIAINEPARMSSFERQYEARAIERGGELFAQNCATCHGTDARGGG